MNGLHVIDGTIESAAEILAEQNAILEAELLQAKAELDEQRRVIAHLRVELDEQ